MRVRCVVGQRTEERALQKGTPGIFKELHITCIHRVRRHRNSQGLRGPRGLKVLEDAAIVNTKSDNH